MFLLFRRRRRRIKIRGDRNEQHVDNSVGERKVQKLRYGEVDRVKGGGGRLVNMVYC